MLVPPEAPGTSVRLDFGVYPRTICTVSSAQMILHPLTNVLAAPVILSSHTRWMNVVTQVHLAP